MRGKKDSSSIKEVLKNATTQTRQNIQKLLGEILKIKEKDKKAG